MTGVEVVGVAVGVVGVAVGVVGVAVGAVGAAATVMTLFQPSIKEARDQTKNFGRNLDKLQGTMKLIAPKIEELDRMNQQHHANISEEEIRVFNKQLEKGKELVITCKAIPRWNKIKKRKYSKMLAELDSSLSSFLNIEFQAQQLVLIKPKQIFFDMEKINKKLDCMNDESSH